MTRDSLLLRFLVLLLVFALFIFLVMSFDDNRGYSQQKRPVIALTEKLCTGALPSLEKSLKRKTSKSKKGTRSRPGSDPGRERVPLLDFDHSCCPESETKYFQ